MIRVLHTHYETVAVCARGAPIPLFSVIVSDVISQEVFRVMKSEAALEVCANGCAIVEILISALRFR